MLGKVMQLMEEKIMRQEILYEQNYAIERTCVLLVLLLILRSMPGSTGNYSSPFCAVQGIVISFRCFSFSISLGHSNDIFFTCPSSLSFSYTFSSALSFCQLFLKFTTIFSNVCLLTICCRNCDCFFLIVLTSLRCYVTYFRSY